MAMRRRNPGEHLSAREVNELRVAARQLKRVRVGPGVLGTSGPAGLSISGTPPVHTYGIGERIKNTEGTTAPAYAIMQVTGVLTETVLEGKQVDNERCEMVAITLRAISTTALGLCFTEGVGYVDVTVGAGESFAVGDRVGPKDGQWTAQVDEGGPCSVLELIDEIPGGGGDVTCIVQLGESYGIPYAYKTTAAPAGGTVTAKRVNSTGAVQGSNITFYVW